MNDEEPKNVPGKLFLARIADQFGGYVNYYGQSSRQAVALLEESERYTRRPYTIEVFEYVLNDYKIKENS